MGNQYAQSVYGWYDTGQWVLFNPTTFETLMSSFQIHEKEDFTGGFLEKVITIQNTVARWTVVETNLNTAIAVEADGVGGVCSLIVDSDDNTEIAALHWGDQESLDVNKGLVIEFRATFSTLPTYGGGTDEVHAVMGVAGAHAAVSDDIDVNAWFRVEASDKTALLWETDDDSTNDDDNATSPAVTLVAGTYNIYRIDFTDLSAVKFYVDNVLVGTAENFSGIDSTKGKVQPYFRASKVDSGTQTGTCTMKIDYILWMQRR